MRRFPSADTPTDISVSDVIHPVFTNQNLGANEVCLQPTLLIEAASRLERLGCLWISSRLYQGKSDYLATRWT